MHWKTALMGLFVVATASAMAQDAGTTAANERNASKPARFSAAANTALDIGSPAADPQPQAEAEPQAEAQQQPVQAPVEAPAPPPAEAEPVSSPAEAEASEGEPLCSAPETSMTRSEQLLLMQATAKETSVPESDATVDAPAAENAPAAVQPEKPNSETTVAVAPKEQSVTPEAATAADPVVADAAPSHSIRRNIPRNPVTIARTGDHQAPWYRTPYAALGGVLVLMAGLTIVFKKLVPSAKPVSADVMSTIGRLSLSPKQTATLLHIGRRVVLVAVGPEGARTLLEISDPEEVAMLLGRASGSSNAAKAFQKALADECAAYEPPVEDALEPQPQVDRNARQDHDATQGQLQGLLSKLKAFQTVT